MKPKQKNNLIKLSEISNRPRNKNKTFKLGELFSGPGGIGLGASKARLVVNGVTYSVQHTWSNDYELDSCKTYIKNICPDNPDSVICEDVRKLTISSLEPIDCFAYGFPCNDFSIVGEKKGLKGTFGPLYSYGVAILNKFKPKFFIAENVKGLSSTNEGKAFRQILNDLRSAGNGYNLTAHLYKFEDYGIPQLRHRIIIVGMDKTINKFFRVPAPTTPNKPITAREAFHSPPIPKDAFNNEITAQSKTVVERLKYIKPDENAWNSDLPERLKLNVKSARMSQIYRRLHPDKPAYTITGSGGGGTHGYHWKEPRALTNRERARIQTFPDDFVFEGSKESVRKQIGMAVSPKMAEIIFNSILKIMAGVDYPTVRPSLVDDFQTDLLSFSNIKVMEK
jgi:DNA (cytosine-5)-methyltransferase 1